MRRNKRWVLGLGLVGLLAVPLAAQSALLLRTIDGVDLYYDSVLDITWHGNANLAATTTFGLPRSMETFVPNSAEIGSTGRMNWSTANLWIDAMNAANYLGLGDWRLPSAFDQDGTGLCSGSNCNSSEMGFMFYENFGVSADNRVTTSNNPNFSLFANVQPNPYWSGVESSQSMAWVFRFNNGVQDSAGKTNSFFAWAVHPGDVAAQAVPEPGTLALLGAGLLGLLGLGHARRSLRLRFFG